MSIFYEIEFAKYILPYRFFKVTNGTFIILYKYQ